MLHKKILFQGNQYWLHESGYCDGLISPLDHYSEDGELLADPFYAISFAIIEGDNIMQYGFPIGKLSDLIEV